MATCACNWCWTAATGRSSPATTPDLWRAALGDWDPNEGTPVEAQADWTRANLARIRAAARDREVKRRIDRTALARTRHLFG